MMNDWRYNIGAGTFFFIAGQILLRKSFDDSNNYIMSLLYFTLAISFMTIIGMVYYNENIFDFSQLKNQHYYSFTAGILFFIGFIFWIYSISQKIELGIIRTFMAGFETLILFIVGYLLFNDKITLLQFFGVLSILLGIFIIGNGH
tara:strand:- start:271 stop:708 length:438 start_codon:yes stop_codon:yes gene_type:complete